MTKSATTARTLYDPKFYLKGKNAGISFDLRRKLNWTQEQVAKLTGYSLASVQGWDQGVRNIPPNALEKLARKAKEARNV